MTSIYIKYLQRLLTHAFLFIFIGSYNPLVASLPKMDLKDNPFNMGDLPKNGLMPMPTEQEMQEIEKFLSTLSDSEIEELIKYGENITKIAEENNIPLFFDAPPAEVSPDMGPKPSQLPFQDVKRESTDIKSKDKNVSTTPTVTKDDIAYYKKTLEALLSIIQKLRLRVTSVKKFETSFKDLNSDLDSLVYYLHVLQKENIVLHLKDKKYEPLVTTMNTYVVQLHQLNDNLELPSIEVLHNRPLSTATKKQLKNAEKTIASIKKSFDAMLKQDTLITTIESLLKEYEPVALQVKQKNEEKEKAAHEFVKKVPVTNVTKQITTPPPYTQPYQGPRQNPTMPQPIKTAAPQQSAKPNDASTSKPKMVEPIKKQQPAKAKKTTLSDLEKEIIEAFDAIEQRLVPHRPQINDFLTTYATSKTEPSLVTSALNEANFGLKKIKSTVEEWHKKLEKESSSKSEMEKKSKLLRDTYKSATRHNNLKTIHTKTKSVAKTGAEGSVKRFKEMMDSIEKHIIDLI